jgi:hypothetical protein
MTTPNIYNARWQQQVTTVPDHNPDNDPEDNLDDNPDDNTK